MRFGKWRVVSLSILFLGVLGLGLGSAAMADGWHLSYTIPREVPAYNYATGGEYYAPPIPYGHYAKDYHAEAAKALAPVYMLTGYLKDLWDCTVGLFHCDGCCHGHGCGHEGGCGHVHGHGFGHGGNECGLGEGYGLCAGGGLFGHGCGTGLGSGSGLCGPDSSGGLVSGGSCLGSGSGLCHKKNFAPCHASTVSATAQVQPAGQAYVAPSGQSVCGMPSCKIRGAHSHLANLASKIRCRLCGGAGCGGYGGMGFGDPCSFCGGAGCGGCGGCGLCHDKAGQAGCNFCGGRGCSHCLNPHGLLSQLTGRALGLLHHERFDWFVGPGGPVPLTPGYVPYVVTTRSPRDYFAFPPMNPNDP
jgi:hypothetical protein